MEPALYLIPVTLGETPIERVLPSYNHEVVMGIRHFIVEEVRSARRFLRKMDREFPIDDSTFFHTCSPCEMVSLSVSLVKPVVLPLPTREQTSLPLPKEKACPLCPSWDRTA